ncbi:MAG TPA: glycoside hydrolase family 38 C-terminal domain-containing protein, partial [Bacteroidota bacterium]
PGMTWNMVPTLAQAGIRYFSSGPNGLYTGGDRTGHTNSAWSDRPFYWVSPSGSERILYWMAGFGYGSFFSGPRDPGQMRFLRSLARYFDWLDGIAYPYDMIQMRHTFNGDNGTVDPGLPDYVRSWNEKHVSPKLAIATTESLFTEFEKKYGAGLPAFGGDFTPYWEDGAASTAYELGVNRTTAEQLVQTEALYTILAPAKYDPAKFYDAWRNVLLFDEHTWGAFNSTSDPDSSFVVKQWEIKQRFAIDGARESGELRKHIARAPSGGAASGAVEVINTNSWERTDLVVLSREASTTGDVVKDETGGEVPSQRLSTGELAFLARHVPALGARRYTLHEGSPSFRSNLRVVGETLLGDNLEVSLEKTTGEIHHLRTVVPPVDYVDTVKGGGLDGYSYVAGLDAREALRSGHTSIAVGEKGPLVASLVVTSEAPGCNALRREIRVVSGSGSVEVINTIDKRKVRANEAVHFGFPFAVPDGVVRVDLGYGVMRPEADQLPGSCKDYYSAQRWADVSNQDYGVTLTVAEAPLVEMGDLHSELPAPRNVDWKTTRPFSSHLASYVMNNYWYTNYKADQEGVSSYHYSIFPHGLYNQADVTRRGIERSQPLVVRNVGPDEPKPDPLFGVSPGGIIVTYLKPVDGGRGCLVRLFNAGGSPEVATFSFGKGRRSVYRSSLNEERGEKLSEIRLPANGIATVRIGE